MEIKHRIILKHIDGTPLNVFYEPVKSIARAARFADIEEYEKFITGIYKPPDASQYYPQLIEIQYREIDNDV